MGHRAGNYLTSASATNQSRSPRSQRRTGADLIAAILLLVQVSALFRPTGYVAGVALRNVSAVSTIVLTLCLFAQRADLKDLYAHRLVRAWVRVIFTVPAVLLLLDVAAGAESTSRLTYLAAFYLYFAIQFLAGAVLYRRCGPEFISRFLTACILATWLGLAINLVDVGFIRRLASYGNVNHADSLALGTTRLIGFQGQANVAAFTLVVLLTALVCNRHFLARSLLFQAFMIGLCLAGILLTGSRTSLLLFIVVFFTYLRNIARTDARADFRSRARVTAVPFIFLLTVIVLYEATADSGSALNSTARGRFSSLVGIFLGQGTGGDESITLRLASGRQYLSSVFDSWFIGRGPDFANNQITAGFFTNVSQNAFLDWALAFGIPYILYVLYTLVRTWRWARQAHSADPMDFAASRLQLVLIVVASFSIINLFGIRPLVLTLSLLVGALSMSSTRAAADE